MVLREVTGGFEFTQDGIDVNDLLVRIATGDASRPDDTNAFKIRGHISGYRPDSPLRLQVDSSNPRGLYFPARPTFLASLPVEISVDGVIQIHAADIEQSDPDEKERKMFSARMAAEPPSGETV